MYSIRFTQYLLPNGRKEQVEFPTESREVFTKAMEIMAAGFHFEAEILQTGQASFTIGDKDGDYVYSIVENGPAVPAAVEAMINQHTVDELISMREQHNTEGEQDVQ